MFTQAEIGVKCACDVPETVCSEHGWKRYRLPAGTYGDFWQPAGYFSAVWMTLECEQCRNRREDITVYKWHSNGDLTFLDGPMHPVGKPRRYADVKRAVVALMTAGTPAERE